MYLTQYEPFFNLAHRLWEPAHSPGAEQFLTPAADVIEEDTQWVFRVDMPGIPKNDIDIQIDGDQLIVSGKRHEHTEEKKDGYTYIERVDGHLERRFVLPETAQRDKVNAKTKNGVLEIHIEKQPEVKPRRIAVEEH